MSSPSNAHPAARRAWWILGTLGLVGLIAWFSAQLAHGSFGYNLFGDRDLSRAGRLLVDFPTAGAEMSGGSGARVPGHMLAALLAVPRLVSADANAAFTWIQALYFASFGVLFVAVGRAFHPLVGITAVALFCTNAAQISIQDDLWNPSLLPLPMVVFTSATLLAVAHRNAAWLPVAATAAAVASQLHFSALGLSVCTALGLAWAMRGMPSWRRGIVAAAACVAALYLPYVVSELLTSGQNTHRMMDQQVGRSEGGTSTLSNVGTIVSFVTTYGFGHTGLLAWVPGASALLGAATGLVALARPTGPARHRGLGVLAVGVTLTTLVIASSGLPYLTHRHVAVLAAPIAVLQAAGVSVAVGLAARRMPRIAPVGLALGAAVALARLPTLVSQWPSGDVRGFQVVSERAALAQEVTGWDLPALTGRTAWLTDPQSDDPLYWAGWPAMQHVLDAQGQSFPGSQPPPCGLWALRPAPDGDWSPAYVSSLLGGRYTVQDVRVLATHGEATFLTYVPDNAWCQTTMVQRYLDLPDEALLRRYWRNIQQGEVSEIDVADGRLFVVGAPSGETLHADTFPLGVRLHTTPEGVRATLVSNQLRGFADNDGWYGVVVVHHPRLVFEATDAQADPLGITFADDLVGGRYAVTPLRAPPATLPPGTYRVRLLVEGMRVRDQEPGKTFGSSPLEVVLTGDYRVP